MTRSAGSICCPAHFCSILHSGTSRDQHIRPLSPEDLPADLKKDKRDSIEPNDNSVYEVSPGEEFHPKIGHQIDSIFTSTSIRFILIMALIIIVLLVALSVLLTMLIMRGC